MPWNKSYETGVPLMDTQHQELFKHLDELSDRTKADRVSQTLDFLGRYVDKHFKDEEQLQLSSSYPQRMEHKKMHSDFVDQYKQLKAEFHKSSEKQGLMILKVNRIAVDWLKKHILGPDMAFAQFLKKREGDTKTASGRSGTPDKHVHRQAAKPSAREKAAPALPPSSQTDAEILKRFSSQALANELVRRTNAAEGKTPSKS